MESILRPSVSEYRVVQFGIQARPVRNLITEGQPTPACPSLGGEPKHKRWTGALSDIARTLGATVTGGHPGGKKEAFGDEPEAVN